MVNKVILIGRLGKDPEIRYLENNVSVVNFSLVTSEYYNRDGQRVEQTEWHNIVMWRGLADAAAKYLGKGRLVYLEGKIRSRSYQDKEGITRHITEIVADTFNMLDKKNASDAAQSTGAHGAQAGEQQVDFKENDDDVDGLPF